MAFKRWAFASCSWLVLLTVLVVVLTAGFKWRNTEMQHYAGEQHVAPLDGQWCGYTPTDVDDLFAKLGADGRKFYAKSEVSLDLVFPFTYGALLIMLAWRLSRPPWRSIVVVLAALTVAADLTENGLISYLAFTYSDQVQPLAEVANLATLTKWYLLAAAVVGLGVGALVKLCKPR